MTLHLLNETIKLLLEANIKFFSFGGNKFIVRGTAHLKDEREGSDCEELSVKACKCDRAIKKNKNGIPIDLDGNIIKNDDGEPINLKNKKERKKAIKLDHCENCTCENGEPTDCESEIVNNQCKVTVRLDDECNSNYARGDTLKGHGDRTTIAVEASVKALIKKYSLDEVLDLCKGHGNVVGVGVEIEQWEKINLINHKRSAKGQYTKGHTVLILDLYTDKGNNIIVKIVTIYPIKNSTYKYGDTFIDKKGVSKTFRTPPKFINTSIK